MKLPFWVILVGLTFCFTSGISLADDPKPKQKSYRVETIPMPTGLTAETGAIAFLPDGRLIACFTRGEVMIYNPETKTWKLFASGFHDALGILVESNTEMLVMQRPELTRIKDTDGDGEADVYENVTDAFGITGNYHEFNYGPLRDSKGNLYIGLNASSSGGDIRSELRGKYNPLGRGSLPGMFSVVPYRGWIMKLSPEGKLLPLASGFRSPNGLGFDSEENLFVTDNQGDWIGTSAMHHVQEGRFYGHPASLVWQRGWNKGSPFLLPISELNKMRTRAAVLFPQGIMANSPSQPVIDETNGKFGPFAGQFLVGEMNQGRIVRVMLEKVGGEFQGACIVLLDGHGLRAGNNRLAFAPDGSLYTGQSDHGWAGDRGIQRIVFTGHQPVEVYSMNLTPTGFDLTFTQPLDGAAAANLANYTFKHYFYEYRAKYGGPQVDVQNIPVTGINVSPDRKKVSLTLASLKPGYIYELNLGEIKSANGESLVNKTICYTLNKLK
jgi:glucose/arabinose dehydrogenase